jgi:4'-phosphopantetheinyl transferase
MDAPIDLWYVRTDQPLPDEVAGRFRELLTPAELQQEARFLRDEHRRQYLMTRVLARQLLGRYGSISPTSIEFTRGGHGKPLVAVPSDFPWQFNLSHTRGLVVCAIGPRGNLGVDVEPMDRRVNLQLADRYFATLEIEALRQLPPELQPVRFLHYWTLKEAFIKALGTGLATPLDKFAFELTLERAPRIHLMDPRLGPINRWRFAQFTLLDKYWGAIAWEEPGGHGAPDVPLDFRPREAQLPLE